MVYKGPHAYNLSFLNLAGVLKRTEQYMSVIKLILQSYFTDFSYCFYYILFYYLLFKN